MKFVRKNVLKTLALAPLFSVALSLSLAADEAAAHVDTAAPVVTTQAEPKHDTPVAAVEKVSAPVVAEHHEEVATPSTTVTPPVEEHKEAAQTPASTDNHTATPATTDAAPAKEEFNEKEFMAMLERMTKEAEQEEAKKAAATAPTAAAEPAPVSAPAPVATSEAAPAAAPTK